MSEKILFLAGSARNASINKHLARAAYEIAIAKGADATFVDLRDYPMPLYDGDLEDESGVPESAQQLKEVFAAHKGLFIASPEYNSSFSPLLKNCIDWMSRPHKDNEPPYYAYNDKVCALTATSSGAIGGLRGLVPLRMLLGNIKVTVLPDQLAVPFYDKVFDGKGQLVDEGTRNSLSALIDELIATVG